MNDGGQRIDRFVLAEDLVAMSGQALAERGPAAGTDADDDPLRVGVPSSRTARSVESSRAARRCDARAPAAPTGPSATARTRENHREPEGDRSKRAYHMESHQCQRPRSVYGNGTTMPECPIAEQLRRQPSDVAS